jgi:hypothetical protein
LNLVRTRSYTVFNKKKKKNRKNLVSDAALKAKMKEQPWWQRKELVKLETLSELD